MCVRFPRPDNGRSRAELLAGSATPAWAAAEETAASRSELDQANKLAAGLLVGEGTAAPTPPAALLRRVLCSGEWLGRIAMLLECCCEWMLAPLPAKLCTLYLGAACSPLKVGLSVLFPRALN